jgi:hypothetical protein
VLVLAFAVLAACTPQGQSSLNWSVDVQSTTRSVVGRTDSVTVTITNNDKAANNLILYLNGKDDWLKHHAISNSGGCILNQSLERLECGRLGAGEIKTINITGSAKGTGTFNFELDIADEEGSQLLHPGKGPVTWSEIVTP